MYTVLERREQTSVSEIDIVQLAARVLEQHGHTVIRGDGLLHHRDSGFIIKPHFLESEALDDGGARTSTAIMTSHPELTPKAIFEYQHSFGATLSDAIRQGFDQWLQLDFAVLLDALRDEPESSLVMEMTFPRKDLPGLCRRAVLGPVAHVVTAPSRPVEPASATDEEHPFCSCCLLRNTYETFRPLMEADEFYGIRLLAARDQNGALQADCRINGEEFPDGKRALGEYAERWPPAGYEFRKQYVVLQTRPGIMR